MSELFSRIDKRALARVAFVLTALALILAGVTAPWPSVPLVAVAGLVVGCWPLVKEAVMEIGHRQMSMELSMLVAIAAAAIVGQWATSLLVTAFALAAEILEDLSMDRGRDALSDLLAFLPKTARVRRGSELATVGYDALVPGDLVVVGPGEAVPVDGMVESGNSSVDQSRITGESLPVDVEPGSFVYAGSVNHVGLLEISAERVGEASSFGQIVQAVRSAQEVESPTQRLGDRIAAWLVGFALIAGAVDYLLTRDVSAALSVVIVAGACGIAAGTPLAVLGALGRAARGGAFVRGGIQLENLATVNTVIFDKTGTLTEGLLEVAEISTAEGWDEDEILRIAASAESGSEHPIGKAIARKAADAGLRLYQASHFDYEVGSGVSAAVDGHTVWVGKPSSAPEIGEQATVKPGTTSVELTVDGQYAGTLVLADVVRPSAAEAVQELKRMGMRVILLTGDTDAAAAAIGGQVGIQDVRAQLLPENKLALVKAEIAAGRKVAMVGDGINDAPSLAAAFVGVAMGSGTEVARRSADVVLISSDLKDLVALFRLSRRMRRIVLANVVGTIAVDLAGMGLAALGIVGPVLAAVIHVVSESAFILNAARLVPIRGFDRSDADQATGQVPVTS
ncbi:MAG: cadmium-translocating P-type ATPase [Propionibacteriaceae bacterium]|nr:cadmium-translocating P-type ATPase [Propionibacteriaceae bacterium]